MASVTQDQVIIRIDNLVSDLKFEGFPVDHIIEEMEEYLNIHYELLRQWMYSAWALPGVS